MNFGSVSWPLAQFAFHFIAVSMRKYFLKISLFSPHLTTLFHLAGKWAWSGLIVRPLLNALTALPVASGKCAALARLVPCREQRTQGQWGPGARTVPSTISVMCGLNCFRNKVWEKPRGKDFAAPGCTPAFFCSSAMGCAGLSADGAKGHHFPCCSRPGANSLWDPSNV